MASAPCNILVMRMSAMGDVAMTVPVLTSLATQHDVKLTLLTTKAFAPMFAGIPGLQIVGIEKRGRHKGLPGLLRLFFDLKKTGQYDAVADLHDVFRSKVLRLLFSLFTSAHVEKIHKGRADKKRLTRQGWQQGAKPLQSSIDRYHDVFRRLGFVFNLNFKSLFSSNSALHEQIISAFGEKEGKWIGLAPFAKHAGKIYPLGKMGELIFLLDKLPNTKIFLFGNGTEEQKTMAAWADQYPSVCLMPSGFRLPEELRLMAQLDVMVSMDSANMHLASLVGLPVVSVWGATHYYAGFLGYKQSANDIVQLDLPCRPCSVYGNKPCKRPQKDYACLNGIAPEMILEKIKRYL